MKDARRPVWVETLSQAYAVRKKNVVVLTGNTRDLFTSPRLGDFVPLEQLLYQELREKFLVVRVDAATGVAFYTDADKAELLMLCAQYDQIAPATQKLGDVDAIIAGNRHSPLPTLVLLRDISEAVTKVQAARSTGITRTPVRPLCIVMQFTGAVFPPGEYDRLSELDRQRLVTLLQWIENPLWTTGHNLLVLVSDTRSELNGRIFAHPGAQQIEIDLPSAADREMFIARKSGNVTFESDPATFVGQSAGLKLTQILDLLEVAASTQSPLTRAEVLREVNLVLEAEIGDIVRIKAPNHGPGDLVGNTAVQKILRGLFQDCESTETAVSGILVSGPNGSGKTFIMEAFARESGRIVIELTGLRGSYFGETDKFFEMLLSRIRIFGKILILMDEAHTAFGSVHKSDTHETERRLAGNLIKMMGDPALLGKVLFGLMTSRPDELDADVKSRCPEQIAVFDSEGAERNDVVRALFSRKGITLTDDELVDLVSRTGHFSMRDFGFLVRKTLAKKQSPIEVLQQWQASSSIVLQRRFQTLLAVQHCSYTELIPESLREFTPEVIQRESEHLKRELFL